MKRIFLFATKLFEYHVFFVLDFDRLFDLSYIHSEGCKRIFKIIQFGIFYISALKFNENMCEDYIWDWSLFNGKKVIIDERKTQ